MVISSLPAYADLVPRCPGRIRQESWGGLYYGREQLKIDLLNDSGYFILSQCDGVRTVRDIEAAMCEAYDAPRELIRRDLALFLDDMAPRDYVRFDGIDLEPMRQALRSQKPATDGPAPIAPRDLSFLGGDGVIGLAPNILSAPIKVLAEMTHNCNLRCVHCFADAECVPGNALGYLPGELTADEWCRVFDNVARAGVFDVFVSGGEALLRKDLFDILAHVRDLGLGFCLLTNTTLIDDRVARRLKDLGCYKIEGNMDGPDAASYDAFRGKKGAFRDTIAGLRACLENGLGVRCNVTVTKRNVHQLKEIVRTAWETGVREVCCVPLEPGGRGKKHWESLRLSMEETTELKPYYEEVSAWVKQEYGDEMLFIGPVDAMADNSENKFVDIVDPNQIMPMCGAGRYHCSIAPTGQVILCPTAGEELRITPGNCLTEDFRTIWLEGDVFKAVRNPTMPGCGDCQYKTCAGGCHVRTYLEYGAIGAGPDPECKRSYREKAGAYGV